jgi:hypothetical protein
MPNEFENTFESIDSILAEIRHVWKFQTQFPTPERPINIEKDVPLKLNPADGTIDYGNFAKLEVGLHAICEQMSRAAEYVVRQMSVMQSQGLTGKPDFLDDVISGKIDGDAFTPDIIPGFYPISSILYDFPLFLALQRQCLPCNIVTGFALLVGWILLMSSEWVPDSRSPEHLGRDYLRMLDEGLDLAREIYDLERRKVMRRDQDAFDGIRMADRICKHFGRQPFSESLAETKDLLNRVAEACTSPDEGEFKSQLYWCARDGVEILNVFEAQPQRFFLPLSAYEGGIKLPLPPVFYKDHAFEATSGRSRTLQHLVMAVLKEFLFASHDMSGFRISDKNFPFPHDECLYGENCVFRPPADEQSMANVLGFLFRG